MPGLKTAFMNAAARGEIDKMVSLWEGIVDCEDGTELELRKDLLTYSTCRVLRNAIIYDGSTETTEKLWEMAASLPEEDAAEVQRKFLVMDGCMPLQNAITYQRFEICSQLLEKAKLLNGEELQQHIIVKLCAMPSLTHSAENMPAFGQMLHNWLIPEAEKGTYELRAAMNVIPEDVRELIASRHRLLNTAQQQDVANSPFKGRG